VSRGVCWYHIKYPGIYDPHPNDFDELDLTTSKRIFPLKTGLLAFVIREDRICATVIRKGYDKLDLPR